MDRTSCDVDTAHVWSTHTGVARVVVTADHPDAPGTPCDGVRVGVPIACDDAEAAQVTAALVRDVGLDPVVVGPLSRAKELDRGAAIWETGASAQDIRQALGLR